VSAWRHVRAILLLPVVATLVVPALIVWWTEDVGIGWGLPAGIAWLPVVVGLALLGAGLALVCWTVKLFVVVGRGTLAPWDPTSRLVVLGPYRRVRNPMISGVACVLAGEAALLGSLPLLLWLAVFAAVNAVYMPLVEEPGLRRRFGGEYEAYCASVPRWVPRRART
jgi:protein-S-isoprenylcysteine O-methyltransferase Ste14